jgi:hypothetical protein
VGWLQARWERRRSLQVPSGVIEVSANTEGGKAESMQSIAICYPVSGVLSPAARGITFLLYTKERVMYRHAALSGYVRKYGVQSRGDDARPSESCFGHGAVTCPVLKHGASRVKA